ncbi:hypothetical protein ISO42_17415 [Morganella morganii subsp. morganii]|uniref:hypothetical protein n=1 Tax=Morganella morganii TaxID=582 RepID=UPI001BDA626A|nr:hypothetical protein [Morganella morganii]MBT0513833.1 hypothetical protein [Morganella morganii subsp. morganii]UNJ80406.1 hypothetical protein [Morganella morganii]
MKENYAVIDKNIESLVNVLNQCGFMTYASCQGHGWPVDQLKPYIAFNTEITKAAKFEKILRDEMESASSRLNWGWKVEGTFNCEYELCFSLRMCSYTRWYCRYFRSSINRDFDTIECMLSAHFKMLP